MPTELDLISAEQLANTLFLVSTIYALASGNQATQHEIERIQGTPPSGSTYTAERSGQLAWLSTRYAIFSYVILTIVAGIRTSILEQNARAGTSTTSVAPSIVITFGFFISLIGAITRLPAIEQRIREAQGPVIL